MKKIVIGVTAGLLLICGGLFAYTNNQNDKNKQEILATESQTQSEAIISEEASTPEKDNLPVETDATAKEEVMVKQGSFVALADYNKDPSKYADSKLVYFFHANWCPICRAIEEDINSDISQIPAGVTFIKTDFDSSIDLRQKYGVTYQYTFVQVDSSGNETAQWSAASLDAAIAGIKS